MELEAACQYSLYFPFQVTNKRNKIGINKMLCKHEIRTRKIGPMPQKNLKLGQTDTS